MNEELFTELLESVREGGEILRGKKSASRTCDVEKPDVQSQFVADTTAQIDFATMLGVSVDTLQNWEQGRRSPQDPARVLLQIAAKHPDVFGMWSNRQNALPDKRREKQAMVTC
jgi:putative transcriptional regulator